MFSRRKRSSSHHQVRSALWNWHDRDTAINWQSVAPLYELTSYARSLATSYARCSISPIRREPCLLKIPTVLEQSLIRRGRRSIAQSFTYPNTGGKCPDKAYGSAEVVDSVAGQSVDHPPLGKCQWYSSPIEQLELDDGENLSRSIAPSSIYKLRSNQLGKFGIC